MLKKLFTLTIVVLLMVGCSDKIENVISFSHENFQCTKKLKGEKIDIPSELSPNEIFVIRDSLVLICNENPAMKNKVGLYNLKTWELMGEFATRGHADNEFIDCNVTLNNNSNTFFLKDMQKSKFWICDIDSLANNKPCVKKQFDYSRDIIDLYPLDTTYVGFNFWYLNDNRYDNIVSPLAEYSMKKANRKNTSKSYKYFVANVTGGVIFKNPVNQDIWVAYKHDNIIEIYDRSLILKKIMQGPNYKKNTYATQKFNGQEMVMFTDKTYTSCYTGCYVTNKHVYLIYENHTCDIFPVKPQPVEVLKFDWSGNCLCNYQLDKFAYTISVNDGEDTMYATCCEENNGEIELIKYKL